MAKITVKFYSLWSLYLSKNAIALEVRDFDEAMEKLDALFGEQLRKKLNKKNIRFGNFKDSSTVLVNGVSLRNIKNRAFADGDILHIFPPIAGG
jgi:molybdopterin converting factor small subunit